MSRRNCHQKPCAKPCPKPCADKVTRYDSWSCSQEECGEKKCFEKVITIKEIKCEEAKVCKRQFGHKIRCESNWRQIPCVEGGKYNKKH